jgi:hypothetical protein
MVRIAITVEAFEAIASTLPLGSVGYENAVNERGERLIWLDYAVVSRLRALRGPAKSYSDVILKAGKGYDANETTEAMTEARNDSTSAQARPQTREEDDDERH